MKRNLRKILLGLLVVGLAVAAWDISSVRESVSRPYNERLEKLALENNLIGKPEESVIEILGKPSYRYQYDDNDYTLNYAPSRILSLNKFQAHFRKDGMLRSIELMD